MNYVIETHRLILREFLPEDAIHLYELNSDPEVIKHTGDEAFKNIEEASQLIFSYDRYTKYGYGRWIVLLKESNEFLGWCGLNFNENIQETDLGFRFMKKYWNRGYATEAAKECLDYGFNQLKLNRIIGRALIENKSSIHVLEKIGMVFEKQFEAHGSKAVLYSVNK